MRKALMERARLLGEGLSGGRQMRNYGLTGGMRKKAKKPRKAKGITGGKVPKQLQGWMAHVKRVRAQHPNKPYKQILMMASKSYK